MCGHDGNTSLCSTTQHLEDGSVRDHIVRESNRSEAGSPLPGCTSEGRCVTQLQHLSEHLRRAPHAPHPAAAGPTPCWRSHPSPASTTSIISMSPHTSPAIALDRSLVQRPQAQGTSSGLALCRTHRVATAMYWDVEKLSCMITFWLSSLLRPLNEIMVYVVMATPLTPANCSFWSDVNLRTECHCCQAKLPIDTALCSFQQSRLTGELQNLWNQVRLRRCCTYSQAVSVHIAHSLPGQLPGR